MGPGERERTFRPDPTYRLSAEDAEELAVWVDRDAAEYRCGRMTRDPPARALAAFLLIALTACGGGGRSGQPPSPASNAAAFAVQVPAEVAGLSLRDSVRLPNPQLGTMYRYRRGGPLRPDVYVYPRPPDETAEGEARAFLQVLEINRRRGRYASFWVLLDRAWSPVEWADGHEIVAELELRQRRRDSYFHVFTVGDRFVKVRITIARDSVPVDEVRGFTEALLTQMGDADLYPERTTPPEPFAVTSGGLNESATYLARVEGGVILFDLGWWGGQSALDDGLEQMDATADDVVAVFLTHAHRDHVGAWKSVRQAPFHLAQAELDLFFGREQPGGWIPRTAARIRERDLPDPGEVATVPFGADTSFVFGADTVYAFLVPGHTAGSAAYLFRGTLFAGDAVSRTMTGRFRVARGGYSDDVEQARHSLAWLRQRLTAHRVDRVCTAHLECTPATDAFWADVLDK